MKSKYFLITLSFFVIAINSCKTLDTNLSISNERSIPDSYLAETDTNNIAELSWKGYFGDSLLVQLIDTALHYNIDLNIAIQRIEMANARLRFARGRLAPDLSFTTGAALRKYGLYTMDGAGNISTEILPGKIVPIDLPDLYLGLQSSWEVDIWGKLRNQKRAALSNYLSSIEGTNFVVSALVADVAVSYYELVALDNELDVIRQTIGKQQEALEIIRFQKDVGRATQLAVEQFMAQLFNTQALEREILQRVFLIENRINFLLGRYPQPIERVKEALFRDFPVEIASGVPSQLLSNRPDIREAEYQLRASKFDLRAAKAAFYPNLNIMAGIGFQAFDPSFLFLSPASIAYSALGGLTVPLINRYALKAQFNTARANQLSAMYNYQKAILNGYVEVVNELSNIENLKEVGSLKQQQSEVLTQSVETSVELYKTARASYLEVLIAQQNALQSNLELINVVKRQRIATVNIYRALGGGWRR